MRIFYESSGHQHILELRYYSQGTYFISNISVLQIQFKVCACLLDVHLKLSIQCMCCLFEFSVCLYMCVFTCEWVGVCAHMHLCINQCKLAHIKQY